MNGVASLRFPHRSSHPLPPRSQSVCHDHPTLPPSAWFGDPKVSPHTEAREVCMTQCPARAACLAYVLGMEDQPTGIFAGLTEPERRRMRKRYLQRRAR